MLGEYVRALGDYPRCRRGCQIAPFPSGTREYEADMTYTGPRLNSAQIVIVDETVRIAPDPASPVLLFHEPLAEGVAFGGMRVHILFDIDPTTEPGPVAVKVTGVDNELGGTTFEVRRLEKTQFIPTL